jgi:hypothetical protein
MAFRPYLAGSLMTLGMIAWHALACTSTAEDLTEADMRDEVKPTLTIVSPLNNSAVNVPSVRIAGTAEDDVRLWKISWRIGNTVSTNFWEAPNTQTKRTDFSVDVPLPSPGPHEIVIAVDDANGNAAIQTINVLYDGTAPKVQITGPANGSQVTTQSVTVTANVTDDQSVKRVSYSLNGGSAQEAQLPGSTASVAVSMPVTGLVTGTNTITVNGYDAANNIGSATLTLVVPPTSTPKTATVPIQLPTVSILRQANGSAQVMTALLIAGDHEANGDKTFQAFVTYRLPADVKAAGTIESAKITIATGTDPEENPGNPFTANGMLCAQRAARMELNDVEQPALTTEQCTVPVLSAPGSATIDIKPLVDASRAAGETDFVVRLRFVKAVGGNGQIDYRVLTVSPLTVTYQ